MLAVGLVFLLEMVRGEWNDIACALGGRLLFHSRPQNFCCRPLQSGCLFDVTALGSTMVATLSNSAIHATFQEVWAPCHTSTSRRQSNRVNKLRPRVWPWSSILFRRRGDTSILNSHHSTWLFLSSRSLGFSSNNFCVLFLFSSCGFPMSVFQIQ